MEKIGDCSDTGLRIAKSQRDETHHRVKFKRLHSTKADTLILISLVPSDKCSVDNGGSTVVTGKAYSLSGTSYQFVDNAPFSGIRVFSRSKFVCYARGVRTVPRNILGW